MTRDEGGSFNVGRGVGEAELFRYFEAMGRFENGCWVYILTNKPNGVLYIGVTADLGRRMMEHREELVEGFSKTHGLKRLVYYERYARMDEAIAREKQLKKWERAWKVRLILEFNEGWEDLYESLND